MGAEQLPSASISGSGNIHGGTYDRIEISGSGVITGNLEANMLSISGSGRADGHVTAGVLHVSGSGTFDRSLSGRDHKISGAAKVSGPIRIDKLTISGALSCEGAVKAGHIHVSGSINTESDLEAEELTGHGDFHVKGLLNANQVDYRMHGTCFAKEIGGESIRITRKSNFARSALTQWFMNLFGLRRYGRLRAKIIEGTTIELDHADIHTVRGDRVMIGPECRIKLVEYSHSIIVDPSSLIERRVQIS